MANEKRLIDVDQAKRATYEEVFWTESEQAAVRNFLAKIPKVDAVEVVRCKDCAWYDECGCCYNPKCTKSYYGCKVSEQHFCSYGERRE